MNRIRTIQIVENRNNRTPPFQEKTDREAAELAAAAAAELAVRHVRYGEKAAKGRGKGVKASAEVRRMCRLYRHLFVVGGAVGSAV